MPPGLVASAAAPEAPQAPAQAPPPVQPQSAPQTAPARGAVYGRASSVDTPSSGQSYSGGVYGAAAAPQAPRIYGTPGAPNDDDKPGPRVYGQPYGAAAEAAAPANAQMAPPRPVVPQQRTPGVYGQRQPEPVEEHETPPQQRTGRPVAWQEQLEPQSNWTPSMPSPPPMARATPADVEIVPVPAKNKLRVLGYALIAVLVVGLGAGALYYTSRTDPPKINSCVKQSGNNEVAVSCSSNGAFQVVSKVTDRADCPDPNQPSLQYGSGSSATWLCLKPAH
jgi:hypothetical protein